MVISCSALGCNKRQNSLDKRGNKVSFHRFPRDKDLCQAWLVASNRVEDFVPTKYSYLCSEHFSDDQFKRSQNGNSSRLLPKAVPTVFKEMPKLKKKVRMKTGPKQVSEKIAPIQVSEKIAPKHVSEVQHLVKIAPKRTIDVPAPVKIAPMPVITGVTSIPDTVLPCDLITAALNAFKQSTKSSVSSEQDNGTPMSIYVVHPQANGTNIVTIPSVSLGAIPSANIGTNPTSNIRIIPTSNQGFGSASDSQTPMCEDAESSSDSEFRATPKGRLKIKKYEDRIKKYQREIKILQQQNRRQSLKIEKLKRVIKDIKNPDFTDDEEDVSEDMSEDEIYAELLKHQPESEYESDEYQF